MSKSDSIGFLGRGLLLDRRWTAHETQVVSYSLSLKACVQLLPTSSILPSTDPWGKSDFVSGEFYDGRLAGQARWLWSDPRLDTTSRVVYDYLKASRRLKGEPAKRKHRTGKEQADDVLCETGRSASDRRTNSRLSPRHEGVNTPEWRFCAG